MNELEKKIEKILEEENLIELEKIYADKKDSANKKDKKIIAEAFLEFISIDIHDYECGKFDNKDYFESVIKILDRLNEFYKSDKYDWYYTDIFRIISELSEDKKEKLKYLDLGINYGRKIKISSDRTLLSYLIFEKMKIEEKNYNSSLEEIRNILIATMNYELNKYNEETDFYQMLNYGLSSFLNKTYDLLYLDFKEKNKYFNENIKIIREIIEKYEVNNIFINYFYVNDLIRIIDNLKTRREKLDESIIVYTWNEAEKIILKLEKFKTDNLQKNNALGNIFEKLADYKNSYQYYDISFKFYITSINKDYMHWDLPVYATNIIKKMLIIKINEKKIDEAEKLYMIGIDILEEADQRLEKDYTLTLYYSEFLYHYLKYIYKFKNDNLIKEIIKKFLLAIEFGKGFYDQAFIGLAKLYYKIGEKNKYLEITKKCGEVFSNDYYNYDVEGMKRKVEDDK